MEVYTGQAVVRPTPSTSYFAKAPGQSSFVVSWSYSECVKQWFRVEGSCFRPPPTPSCPPYPQPSSDVVNCLPQDLSPLPTLYNSGLAEDRSLLAACSIDPHVLLLPSQSPYVVDAADVPGGTTPPTSTSQYIGVDCNGKSDYNHQFVFRFPFVCPENVDPQTLKITVLIDTPCQLVDIVINGNSTGFSSLPLVNAKQFVLSGFSANVNTIDFPIINVLSPLETPPIGGVPVLLMVRFTEVVGCVGAGGFAPGDGPICKFNYKANVRACDAEDVCRILKENGPIFPIKSITIPNESFDVNCYINVTPDLNDCVECCDFLIDENRQEDIFGNSTVYEIYEYTGVASLVGTPSSGATLILVYVGEASIAGAPNSEPYVIYGPPISEAMVFGFAESGTASTFYLYDGIGSIVPTAESYISSSDFWSYDGIGSVVGTPSSSWTGSAVVFGTASVKVFASTSSIYVYVGSASVVATASSSGGVTNVLYTGIAHVVPTASSIFGASFLEYSGLAKGVLSAASQVQFQYTGVARASLYPSSGLYAFFNYSGLASVLGTGATTVTESPVWVWDGVGFVLPTPDSEYSSSDLGVFTASGDLDNEILDEMIILQAIPAETLVVNFPNLNLIGCCSSIAQNLQLRHNLGSIPKFANFLLRNGLVLPGQLVRGRSESFIPVTYSDRVGGWVGNLHLEGLSTSGPGKEQWNLTVTMMCVSNWLIGIRLVRTITGLAEILRLTTTYLQPQFCPVTTGFVGFSYAVDVKTQVTTPAAESVVFHDESGWTDLSPSSLFFIISTNNGPTTAITSISSLNSQLQAANALI